MIFATESFASTMTKMVNELTRELCSDDEEWSLSRELNALPICVSLYSYVLLHPNGTVISTGYKENELEFDSYPQSVVRTLAIGSRRWPALNALIPYGTEDAATCEACSGSGKLPAQQFLADSRCIICAGLGWVLKAA